MIQINKIMPNICKHGSCLGKGSYEFTKLKTTKSNRSMHISSETIIIGYSCGEHVEEVNKLLKSIYLKKTGGRAC